MHIYCGGSATATTVNAGGYMTIYSGGNATSTTVNSAGRMGGLRQRNINDGELPRFYDG
ncbi:MAG: AIDA repeat-containing protein [Lentisphaeria bacterium]|nr:MAG: AIDA repeat-containing protein [Lentisphaeria bacterium]